MKQSILFCSILAIFILTGCAATAPVLRTPDVSEGYHQISFMAYTGGTELGNGKKSIAGHASISIDRSGVWGFYPSIEGRPITKKGILKYSSEYPRAQEYADFFVDTHIMRKIQEVITDWKTNPPSFVIPINDCNSFLYQICDIIGLRYNRLALLPVWTVRDIRSRNDQNKIYKGQYAED